jgi:hypothetical protein
MPTLRIARDSSTSPVSTSFSELPGGSQVRSDGRTAQVEIHEQRRLRGVVRDAHGEVDRHDRLAGCHGRRGDGHRAPAVLLHLLQHLRAQQVEGLAQRVVLVQADDAVLLQVEAIEAHQVHGIGVDRFPGQRRQVGAGRLPLGQFLRCGGCLGARPFDRYFDAFHWISPSG